MNSLLSMADMMRVHAISVLKLLSILWIIHIINRLCGYRLNLLGIHPRQWYGLPGVICSPFLHQDFTHLLFNSIPLFILMNFVLLGGWSIFYCVTISVILLSGLGIWIFGRDAIHIGASGVVMGYWSYLLVMAYQHPSWLSIFLALVTLYYFGGFIAGLFPTAEKFSWEGHLSGFVAGVLAAYFC